MKSTAIAMAAILMVGLVLSLGFTSADSWKVSSEGKGINANVAKVKTGERSVSIGDVDDDEDSDNDFDIRKANKEIDDEVGVEARESTFAKVSIGNGWAISSGGNNTTSEGSFARIFWVEKTFVISGTSTNATNETNQTNTTETTEARGTLKIGSDLYKLVLDSKTEDTMTFNVVSEKGKVNGTLELEADISLVGFTVWSGTLDIDSGTDYEIHAATKNSKVKGSVEAGGENEDEDKQPGLKGNLNAETRGEGKKIGLFARIAAFFRGE